MYARVGKTRRNMNSKTMFYIVKRLLLALVTVFVVVTVTFWAMQAIPGGPFNTEKAIDESVKQQLMRLYGLDKPLFIQYLRYLGNSFIWNFGVSLKTKNTTIMSLIGQNLPYSLITGLSAAALAIIIGAASAFWIVNPTFQRDSGQHRADRHRLD